MKLAESILRMVEAYESLEFTQVSLTTNNADTEKEFFGIIKKLYSIKELKAWN